MQGLLRRHVVFEVVVVVIGGAVAREKVVSLNAPVFCWICFFPSLKSDREHFFVSHLPGSRSRVAQESSFWPILLVFVFSSVTNSAVPFQFSTWSKSSREEASLPAPAVAQAAPPTPVLSR
jgi:hypothetical protein